MKWIWKSELEKYAALDNVTVEDYITNHKSFWFMPTYELEKEDDICYMVDKKDVDHQ